ncbi:MAG: hypothetical protein B6245_06045 [Desulfobacteraceae bacterium 4572_88]|nr:MAG: hypothetical protein B6245_06045 [Desulfobacteraceae bacterium 4572_88]
MMTFFTSFLKNSIYFETPLRLTDVRSWHGHIPFAFAIMEMLRPKTFVELGTHRGDSYCAFCQAAQKLDLDCACHAIDSWEGDAHAGFYGPETFEELRAYHDPLYGSFSRLLKMKFDEAIPLFPDSSTDLLHIDGLHSYEAVRHDFHSWLPKMSEQGLILLHDTRVREQDFGVWKLWEELREGYPGFEFRHSHGLGVLGVGEKLPLEIRELLNLDGEAANRALYFFSGLGQSIRDRAQKMTCQPVTAKSPAHELEPSPPDAPRVSVIIPAYNHERYLKAAIDSVLEQTVTDFELIIINDGSEDNTEEIVRGIRDKRIQYVCQENQGAHNALNLGIRMAKGEFVSILNSDDVYDIRRFEECLEVLEKNPSVYAVFSHIELIDAEGNVTDYKKGAKPNWLSHQPETSFKGENNIILDLLAGNFLISTSNLFCRRTVFQDIGFFLNLKYAHDYDFFLRLCYHFKVHVIEKPLFRYRIHQANTFAPDKMAEVGFEVGFVLSNFLLKYDLRKILPDEDIHTSMVRFFNSVNTFDSDRIIMTLLLFGLSYKTRQDILPEPEQSAFKKACVARLKSYLNLWQEYQEGWAKWRETNAQLIQTNKKLSDAEDKATRWWLDSKEAWHKVRETEKARADMEAQSTRWWQESQTAWGKWHESNERLIKADERFSDMEAQSAKWWRESQEAWGKWSETNANLLETEKKLAAANERLTEKTAQLRAVTNSRSYRMARALSWPLRRLRHGFS